MVTIGRIRNLLFRIDMGDEILQELGRIDIKDKSEILYSVELREDVEAVTSLGVCEISEFQRERFLREYDRTHSYDLASIYSVNETINFILHHPAPIDVDEVVEVKQPSLLFTFFMNVNKLLHTRV